MRNVVLFCAAGMSTSLMVNKMQKAADDCGYDAKIAAYPIAEAPEHGPSADVIMLGPQVRFELDRIKGMFPDKPVIAIDMMAYGMMDGKKVFEQARAAISD